MEGWKLCFYVGVVCMGAGMFLLTLNILIQAGIIR